jgi:recombination endonuclease VII
MSRGRKYRRECRNCGAPTADRRATCSEACRVAVVHTDSREERTCPQCAKVFRIYPSVLQVCCSWACARLRPRPPSARVARACKVCESPTRGARVTCSDACATEVSVRAANARRARSSAKSVKRTAAKKKAYRSADKRMVEHCLYDEQDGTCAVCGSIGGARGDGSFGLVLDHCHRTGAPRALLCGRCNAAVVMVRENVAIARSLAEYVRRVCK